MAMVKLYGSPVSTIVKSPEHFLREKRRKISMYYETLKWSAQIDDVIMMSYLLVCSDWSIALRW